MSRPAHDTRLLERDAAQKILDDAYRRASAGCGAAVYVIGAAGLGKTSLLHSAQTRNRHVAESVYVQGHPLEASLPFALLDRILPGITSALSAPAPNSLLVHEVALATLRSGVEHPKVYLLDDLHWVDSDSLRVLAYLARRIGDLPVALIAAMRPWPGDAARMAETLEAQAEGTLIRLKELTFSATHDLLGLLVGRVRAPQFVGRAYSLSAGNPLLITEAARQVVDYGTLPHVNERPSGTFQQTLVRNHLAGLSPQSTAVAEAIAVLGSRTKIGAVEAVSGCSPDDFAEAVDSLLTAKVLMCEQDWLWFRHDLLASALLDEMPKGKRRLLHVRAFNYYRGLQERNSCAAHAVAASMIGDNDAVAALETVGDEAMSAGAVDTAVRLLGNAVKFAGENAGAKLLASYGDALLANGEALEANRTFREAARRSEEPGERVSLLRRQAVSATYAGQLNEALTLFSQTEHELGPDVPSEVRLEHAYAAWLMDGPEAGLDVLTRSATSDESSSISGARALGRLHSGRHADLDHIEALAAAARRLTQSSSQTLTTSFNPFLIVAFSYYLTERYDDAIEVADLGVSYWKQANAPLLIASLRLTRMAALLRQGHVEKLLADAETAAQEMSPLTEPYLWIFRAAGLIWAGHKHDAAMLIDQVSEMQATNSVFVDMFLRDTRGQFYLAAGEAPAAIQQYRQLEEMHVPRGATSQATWVSNAIEAYATVGWVADIERLVVWLEESHDRHHGTWKLLASRAGRAALASSAGDDKIADRLYQSALAIETPASLDRLRICLQYGRWLRRHQQTKAARAVLAQALRDAETMGAHALTEQLHAELLAAGGRRRRNSGARLTLQQGRVAELAMEGITAREIAFQLSVSVRTVESHLSSIYRALGISSRAQLRALAQAGGLDLSTD